MNPEWLIRSKTTGFKRQVAAARELILSAHKMGKLAIAWSGGKDSTAMCHMVKTLIPDCPIITQFDDCDWPEKQPYIDRVANTFSWSVVRVMPDFSVRQMMNRYEIGNTDFCDMNHAVTRESFLKPLNMARQEINCIGWFMGLRLEESKHRNLNYLTRGAIYTNKDDTMRCTPIIRWNAADVFAYHVAHGIEINPLYLNNRFKRPEDVRLCWAIPTPIGSKNGDMENLRTHYPEQYRKLREGGKL